MDAANFDKLFSIVCNNIAANGKVEDNSERFAKLTSDADRFEFVNLLKEAEEVMPLKRQSGNVKITTVAEALKNKGNDAFKKKSYNEALQFYTQCICSAPLYRDKTDLIALAFGNRSAALFYMKLYQESITDIENGLKYGYPENLMYKLLERKGRCQMGLFKYIEAKQSFCEAISLLDKSDLDASKKKNIIKDLNKGIEKCCSFKDKKNENSQASNTCSKIVPSSSSMPSFKGSTNETFPSLSNAIDVVYTPAQGRYLVAKRDLKPGEVILIEKPFASVVLDKRYFSHCHHCFDRTLTPLPCESCVEAKFCSKKCMDAAKVSYHKYECGMLSSIHVYGLDKFAHLALRTVTRQSLTTLLTFQNEIEKDYPFNSDNVKKGCAKNGTYESDEYVAIFNLVTHAGDRTPADLFKRAIMALYLLRCLQASGYFEGTDENGHDMDTAENRLFIGGLLLSHLQLLPCNAHEVSELMLDPTSVGASTTHDVGAGIYATLSLFNHSCNPAVTRNFYRDTCVVRTIRCVKAGEEVSDNYGAVYEMQTKVERLKILEPQYFFRCECEACKGDWPTFDKLPTTAPIVRCPKCFEPYERHPVTLDSNVICSEKLTAEDLGKFAYELGQSEMKFQEAFQELMNCRWSGCEAACLHHLEQLDRLVPPWQGLSSCQEALKQCYNILANCHVLQP